MSAEQIKDLICSNGYSPYKPRKMRKFVFFLVQTFLDANTDFDFRMKSKYKVQGFLKKQLKTLHFANSKTTAKCFAIVVFELFSEH